MAIKKCLLLVLVISSLSLASLSLAFEEGFETSPQRELEQCRSRCQEQQPRGQQRQLCEHRCEQKMREREEREHRGSRDDEFNPNVSPQREYEQCQSRCQKQERPGSQRQLCEQRCEEKMREREREEREHRGSRDDEFNPDVSPQREYEQCRSRCQQQQRRGPQLQQCEQRCEEKMREREQRGRKEEEENPHKDPEMEYRQCQQRCQQREPVQERRRECEQECDRKYREGSHNPKNPYHFTSQRLRSRFRSAEGHLKVLEKLSTRSELLKGIKNYRIVVLEAAPNTFVVPHHCDADTILVVTKGKGTISIVTQNNKESHNVERSDMVIVRAGSTVYLVNQDNNEQLQVTKLVTPVNIPGQFEEYYPGGGETPQSYLKAFSSNILKQTLSATEEQIERLLGEHRQGQREEGQRQGIIKRASQEQLKALSQHATTSPRRKGRETSGPISLQNLSPLYSNNYGKFHQINPEDNKHLEDLDVFVNWCEIRPGSIMVPHYNSKATVLVAVVEGSGRMEMACPHLARERRRQQQQWGREEEETGEQTTTTTTTGQYEKVSATLSRGDVFIIPAGHPIAVVATENQNLRMVGFGVNARNNERNFVAGKDNMLKQLEREAKELAFNMPGREVEQIFNQAKLSYFVPQNQQQEEGHRTHPLDSILNFAGFA